MSEGIGCQVELFVAEGGLQGDVDSVRGQGWDCILACRWGPGDNCWPVPKA
jgi:hypothetical protein